MDEKFKAKSLESLRRDSFKDQPQKLDMMGRELYVIQSQALQACKGL